MPTTAKDQVRRILDRLPDDSSYQEIEYSLYLHRKVEQGLADLEQGRLVDQEEVEKRMARWLDE